MTSGFRQSASTTRQSQQTVPITICVPDLPAAADVPVLGGICVPRGLLSDAKTGHLTGDRLSHSVQLDVVNRWSDQSVRWMTVSSIARLDSTTMGNSLSAELAVSDPTTSSPDVGLTQVRTLGPAILILQQQIEAERPSEARVRVEPVLRGKDGQPLEIKFDSVREEIRGHVRQVSVVGGQLSSEPHVKLQFRITVWPGTGILQLETRIRNTRRARHRGGLWDLGDPASFLFGSLELRVTSKTLGVPETRLWSMDAGADARTATKRFPTCVIQHGSGGVHWDSPNHVAADGTIPIQQRGFELSIDGRKLHGERAEPVLGIQSSEEHLIAAVPEFWQQFPSSLSIDDHALTCGLFPDTGYLHELQGGEQKTLSIAIRNGPGTRSLDSMAWVFRTPRIVQPSGWYQSSGVFPWFPGALPATRNATTPVPTDNPTQRYVRYLEEAIDGPCSVAARREAIDEYGWRNFGDIHADHEQTHFVGSQTIVSHYNNQFDLIFGGILNLAATGQPKWFEMFDAMARHVMDIDIYHTTEDRAVWNGGLFWHTDHYVDARTATHRTYSSHNQIAGKPYGGGPCNEHNYTTGLLHYYFLTGHPEAREAVLSLAEWVIQMDDGRHTVFGLLDDGPTGYASHTVSADYHGPGRGAGNSVNALMDAWLLTGLPRHMDKTEELICRCVHPVQDIDKLGLLDAEEHWSYTVFLTALGRYLLIKNDSDQRDEMYAYARSTLAHYGRWMTKHERPTLSSPEKLEYPTEAWAAQDFRKANVLRIAASCEDDASAADAMRAAADRLSDAAWTDLYGFGRQHLTARCLSILMTEGQRDLFHRTNREFRTPSTSAPFAGSGWSPFVPQRRRVRHMLKTPRGVATAAGRCFNPIRLLRAARSFLRYQ
jgi:hypothetical protein